jgi:Pyruvate/2-oxoacid:ferredoxin oxidoreductase delta subunit
MKPEGLLLHSQHPTNGPPSKPDEPVHTLPPYFLKTFYYNPQSRPLYSKQSSSFKLSNQNLQQFIFSPARVRCPTQLILLDFIILTRSDTNTKQNCTGQTKHLSGKINIRTHRKLENPSKQCKNPIVNRDRMNTAVGRPLKYDYGVGTGVCSDVTQNDAH